jgi:hypothetical protein
MTATGLPITVIIGVGLSGCCGLLGSLWILNCLVIACFGTCEPWPQVIRRVVPAGRAFLVSGSHPDDDVSTPRGFLELDPPRPGPRLIDGDAAAAPAKTKFARWVGVARRNHR